MGLECGGGTVLIFLLTTVSETGQHIAQGANLVFFIPTCIVSIAMNLKSKNIELKTATVVVIFGIVGAIIGASISINIQVNYLRNYFGYFLLIISIFEIYSLIKSYRKNKKDNNIKRI